MRPNLIVLLALVFCVQENVSAQNPNPFELLWRKGSEEHSAVVKPVPVPEPPAPVTIDAPIPSIVTDTQKTATETPPNDAPDSAMVFLPPDTATTRDSVTSSTEDPAKTSGIVSAPAHRPHSGESPLLFVILFGIVFSLLAWILSLNREVLQKIYRAAMNENLSSLLFREQRFATTQYLYYTIYIVFFLNAGMFLYFLSRQFGWDAWALSTVWSCIAIVFTIYMLRHIWMAILGSTYPVTKEMTHFSFSILLHNILLGIALIPVNLFLAFGAESLYKSAVIIGILLCVLIYLMRQFRGLVISGSTIGTHPFHFFVYLCAVEILPLFTLVKFFHN